MFDWRLLASPWTIAIAGGSLAVSVIGLFATRWFVLSLPADFFVAQAASDDWRHQHPLVRWVWFAIKNLIAIVLILAGLAMLAAPGPGMLTILLGVCLLSFPGKWKFVLWLVRRPQLLAAMNALRRRAGLPDLVLPPLEETPLSKT
jgi:hypothetical protein